MWIKREISNIIGANSEFVQILTGPRQCGKSSLLAKLDSTFLEVSMDNFSIRELAQKDPDLFLSEYKNKKLLIDEVQLAPQVFSAIKGIVDRLKRNATPKNVVFRLTGSNQILFDKNVKESLVGRASYFELNTLSVYEITKQLDKPIQEILFAGGWPELYAYPETNIVQYLNDYITSYIEKDIVLAAGVQKQHEFLLLCKLLAGRTAQLLNVSELAKEIGVDTSTVRDWISILEKMKIIVLVAPYHSNYSKRLIKSPKVYFVDTGLACRLQGWSQSNPISASPLQGALFETLVFSEIYKMIKNNRLNWSIYHWRSREGEEVDFLIQIENSEFLFVEAKVVGQELPNISTYPEVKKVFKKNIPKAILCHMEGEILGHRVPIRHLRNYLMKLVQV